MTNKEKQIIKVMSLKAEHKDGVTNISGELSTEMYNKIMNSKETNVKPPRTPEWAKELIAKVEAIDKEVKKINERLDRHIAEGHK